MRGLTCTALAKPIPGVWLGSHGKGSLHRWSTSWTSGSIRHSQWEKCHIEKLPQRNSSWAFWYGSFWCGFSVDTQVSIGHSSQLWIWEKAQLSCGNLEYWRRKYMCQQAAPTILLERIKNNEVDGIKKGISIFTDNNDLEGYPGKNIYLIKQL